MWHDGGLDIVGPKWILNPCLWHIQGKRVAVIGTGASAIQVKSDDNSASIRSSKPQPTSETINLKRQVIPAIAGEVSHLTVFQRSPPYVLPKLDYAFSGLPACNQRNDDALN